MPFKIVVYAQSLDSFEAVKKQLQMESFKGDIVHCDPVLQTRADALNHHAGEWLLFVDHDCLVKRFTLDVVENLVNQAQSKTEVVYSGLYADLPESGYLQRAHNFIANTWVQQSYSSDRIHPLFLGGAFLVCSQIKVAGLPAIWGAEDKLLAFELGKAAFEMHFAPQLQVHHLTSPTLRHFIRRAWLQGYNDAAYFSETANSNWNFWFQKLVPQGLVFVPAVLLHFCIQKAARWFQKVRHMNS